MIELSTTATFDRLFEKLSSVIQQKAVTKTDLFKSNPFHPSLHTEKLHPKHHEVWSFRQADPSEAKRRLGWQPTVTFRNLVRIMVDADLEAAGLPAPGQGRHCLTDGRLAWLQRP